MQNFPQSFSDIRILSLRGIPIVLRQGNYKKNIQKKIFNVYRKKLFGNASDNYLRDIREDFFQSF